MDPNPPPPLPEKVKQNCIGDVITLSIVYYFSCIFKSLARVFQLRLELVLPQCISVYLISLAGKVNPFPEAICSPLCGY